VRRRAGPGQRRERGQGRERGQASVEVVLLLPLVVLLALGLVQVALVGRAQLSVVPIAHDAARAAALGGDAEGAARRAAAEAGLDPARLVVRSRTVGALVVVAVTYRVGSRVPIVGPLARDVEVSATSSQRRES